MGLVKNEILFNFQREFCLQDAFRSDWNIFRYSSFFFRKKVTKLFDLVIGSKHAS